MTAAGATLALLPVEAIRPNPANRPEGSGRAEMGDMVASVQALGILEPLIVRPAGAGQAGYLLMAGERRWAAAKAAGQLQVPAMVWRGVHRPEVTDLLVILTENWQRVPMSAVEVARMLGKLNETMSVAKIARLMGRRPATVYWYLELLKADDGTLARLERGEVTSGQVRTAIRAQIAPPPGHGRADGKVTGRSRSRIPQAKPARAAQYFNATHRLATAAHALCTGAAHPAALRIGRTACGPCWEAAIAQDAVQAVTGSGNGAPAGRVPDWAAVGGEGWDPLGRLGLAGKAR
jgi:ParB family transcriptional regulator, chromosome partitioning protein